MYHSKITGLGYYVPENIVTNDDLAKIMDTNDEWIQERTGIQERRNIIRGEDTTTSMGVKAAKIAIERAKIDNEVIESLNEGLRSFGESAKQLNETITAASAISEYNGQIQEGVKNMNALNSLYELQLQTSNQQMEATNLFLQNLQSSVEDSKKFQQQVANLAENLEALNSVYANMLNAMNPNK